jgi:ssDNA-binding Zn-finger/Zn-ribbon topoisomerase 1
MFENGCDMLNTDRYKFKETVMNYQRIYNLLVEKAQNRTTLDGYKESHHIIPRGLGGSNDSSNLVDFTAREHFIAHLLLAKIYGGGMWHAAHMMSNMKRYTNRKYETARKEHAKRVSKLMSGKVVSDATKEKQKETLKRLKQERQEAGLDHWLKGVPKTEEHKEAYKKARIAGGGWVCPESRKEQLKITMKGEGNHMWGRTHNEEARKIISEANKQQVTCPHCGTTGAIAIMGRWHFDNCKSAPNPKPRKKYPKQVCPHCGKEGGGAQMIANHFENCRKKLTE